MEKTIRFKEISKLRPGMKILFKPYDFEIPIITSPARFKVLILHRKSGKTTLALNELIRWARVVPDKVFWYIAPTYKQAKEIVWKDPQMLSKYLHPSFLDEGKGNKGRNETELTVYFKSGSVLSLKGADDPDSLRGPNPYFTVCDEYALMSRVLWDEILQPVARANPEAKVWFIGTPKPTGQHLQELYELTKNPKNKDWFGLLMTVEDTNLVSKEEIEKARMEGMTQAAIEQEFYCKFLSAHGVIFRKIDQLSVLKPKPYRPGHQYKMGIDLGRLESQTAIAVYDLSTRPIEQVYLDYFDTIDWNLQEARIISVWASYNKPRATIDATGKGDPIVQSLERKGMYISEEDKFIFTNTSKKNLIDNLAQKMETEQVRLLNDREQNQQLKIYGYEKTPAGNIRYGAPEGKKDDIVHANALALWGVELPPLQVKTPSEDEYYSIDPIEQTQIYKAEKY